MTLIVALGNEEQVIQISDRRLSSNGTLMDEESNKAGVLMCENARMAFGYTGFAKWYGFSTRKWLLDALHKAGDCGFDIGRVLENLKEQANETFSNHPLIGMIPAQQKSLAIMFSGYINLDGYWKQGCAVLSNFHDFDTNTRKPVPSKEFRIEYSSARLGEDNPTLVQRVGNWSAMTDKDIDLLREMLEKRKPSRGIIGKATKLIHGYSDNPKSKGSIGKQLSAIKIPKNINVSVSSEYISAIVKRKTYMPSMVYLLSEKHLVVDGVSIAPVKKDTLPLSIPRVPKNAPCPCGSGKKFKWCHGKGKSLR